MTSPATGLHFDPDAVGRLAAELHQLALHWLDTGQRPTGGSGAGGAFGTDPEGAELSSALPVFVARVAEARARGCALLDAAGSALARACAALEEGETAHPRPGGAR